MKPRFFALFLIALNSSCGQERVVEKPVEIPSPGPAPNPPPPAPIGPISYQQMQGYLVTYCQSCHASAQFMGSESALRSSQVKNNLSSRRMPPTGSPKTLPDNTRQLMLGFF